MDTESKPTPTRVRKKWILLCVAATLVGGWAWVSRSRSEMASLCDRAVFEMRDQIERRLQQEIDEAARAEQWERSEAWQQQDATARDKRFKWTSVVNASTRAMFNQTAISNSDLFTNVGHRSGDAHADVAHEFWSFRRLHPVQPPTVVGTAWGFNPIDQFIFARLAAAGLAPNASASRRVLARRLWFDMNGLPPSEKQIDEFVDSTDEDAYEQLVEQLLNNSGFGERWGRVWLDLARYADSNGYEEDELRPNAYPYRDFVIWAMNNDLPFDTFLHWQIAGDELAADNPMAVAATGFLTAAPLNTFIPQESERLDELDDITSTIGRSMLGLTVGCARCHDHMYDPISTDEYYGLIAVFSETRRTQSYLVPDGGKEFRKWFDPVDVRQKEIRKLLHARIKEDNISDLDYFTDEEKDILRLPLDPDNEEQDRLISLCKRCLLITEIHIDNASEPLPKDQARYDELVKEIDELEAKLPPRPPMGLTLTGSAVSQTYVLEGGDLNCQTEKIGPRFLSAVTPGHPKWTDDTWKQWAPGNGHSVPLRPRSALAKWMTNIETGSGSIVARVIVNRLWQNHFGTGLVTTASDFGSEGAPPSHPELLEWLANELVEHDWSLKHIHRLIVTSATYRQSGAIDERKESVDPENRLVGRRVPRRMTAEMIRDTLLSVAGNLNHDMYGPGVQPPIPRDAVYNTQEDPEDTWPCDFAADRPAVWRRSVYVMLKRTVPIPILDLYDAPDASFSCDDRKTTTVPTQALALWNSPFVTKQARRLAERILRSANTEEEQVQQLFRWALSRSANQEEVDAAVGFLHQGIQLAPSLQQKKYLTDLCHVVLMSNEFFYID